MTMNQTARFNQGKHMSPMCRKWKRKCKISTGGGAPVTGILTISHPSTQRNIVSWAGLDTGTVDTSSHTSEGAMTWQPSRYQYCYSQHHADCWIDIQTTTVAAADIGHWCGLYVVMWKIRSAKFCKGLCDMWQVAGNRVFAIYIRVFALNIDKNTKIF